MGLRRLHSKLAKLIDQVDGILGISVLDVEHGEEIGIRSEEKFPLASVCKTPILVEAYRQVDAGAFSLKKRIAITRETRTAGSGLLNFCDVGLKPTLRDLLLLMIVVSDNAATDLVLAELGGPEAVTATMATLGLPEIQLNRTIRQLLGDIQACIDSRTQGLDFHALTALFDSDAELVARFHDPERVRAAIRQTTVGKDEASPRAIAHLYGQIAQSACASASSCAAILQTLERQQLRGRLPRDLPPNTRFCHKTGTLGPGTVTNDSGLLFVDQKPIAIAVLSREVVQAPSKTNTDIARIGRAVYDHFAAQ